MKGIIFNLLENLVIDKFGDEIMEEIFEEAEFSVDAPPFIATETYPVSDLVAIVALLSEKSNIPIDDLIYEFGKYMFPN
ncbi:MAG: guanylate cyclase, partial [Deltaproteobacteria bacterium]|nr:guanylate cyclase [Deltaproteobacteria bacterium]